MDGLSCQVVKAEINRAPPPHEINKRSNACFGANVATESGYPELTPTTDSRFLQQLKKQKAPKLRIFPL